jgi:hypothetical protein
MSLAISSKKRLVVWVIAGLGFEFKSPTTMDTVCSARKGDQKRATYINQCGSDLSARPADKVRARPLDFAGSLPASPLSRE